jgi:undecaprenyl-diphosphatase
MTPLTVDRDVVRAAYDFASAHSWCAHLARWLTHLGDPVVVTTATVVAAALLIVRGRRSAAIALLVSRAGAIVGSSGLKLLVDRPRPHLVPALAHASGASFPSGHALGSAALWGTVALLVSRSVPRAGAVAIATVVPVLVAVTRVFLGVHYPSDVLAGLVIGWAVAVGAVLVARRAVRAEFARGSRPVHRPFTRRP